MTLPTKSEEQPEAESRGGWGAGGGGLHPSCCLRSAGLARPSSSAQFGIPKLQDASMRKWSRSRVRCPGDELTFIDLSLHELVGSIRLSGEAASCSRRVITH